MAGDYRPRQEKISCQKKQEEKKRALEEQKKLEEEKKKREEEQKQQAHAKQTPRSILKKGKPKSILKKQPSAGQPPAASAAGKMDPQPAFATTEGAPLSVKKQAFTNPLSVKKQAFAEEVEDKSPDRARDRGLSLMSQAGLRDRGLSLISQISNNESLMNMSLEGLMEGGLTETPGNKERIRTMSGFQGVL